MTPEKLIPGIILASAGLLFFFNNENIAKGAAKFYKKIYTEKNLRVMFKIIGVILVVGAVLINTIK